VDVRAAFLDHCAPSLTQVLGALGGGGRDDRARPPRAKARAAVGGRRSDGAQRRSDEGADSGLERAVGRGPMRSGKTQCVVVPLLLTAAYHSKSDIPAQLAVADAADALAVRCAATLGPHPLLLAALERRLREAGVGVDSAADRARTAVVLAAAGSSDPAANATIADLAARWRRERGWRTVVPAYASAAGPSPAAAVAALRADCGGDAPGPVVVATYLLAPGYFADKIRAAALEAGASTVSGVLGAAPEVADVVLARYREAQCERLPADTGYAERAVVTTRLVTCSIRGNPRGTDLPARAPRRA
jgi:sirohydrochlorin ferrochelatase